MNTSIGQVKKQTFEVEIGRKTVRDQLLRRIESGGIIWSAGSLRGRDVVLSKRRQVQGPVGTALA